MNTLVTITLPAWMVYGIAVIVVLQIIEVFASIYLKWLERKLTKLKYETDDA